MSKHALLTLVLESFSKEFILSLEHIVGDE